MPTPSPAETPEEVTDKIRALSKQGNHREAADLGKKALAGPDAAVSGDMLSATIQALFNLNAYPEQEEVIEAAAKAHPKHAGLLAQAASSYSTLIHGGMVIDGKFERGHPQWHRGGGAGSYANTQLRDRVRALQLNQAAWQALPKGADAGADTSPPMLKANILGQFISYLQQGGRYGQLQAWSLQHLTDLSTLPDYDEQSGLDSPASGYPVNEKGEPVFFNTAASWEAATSDGERLLWALEEQGKQGPAARERALNSKAHLAKLWFSVRSVAGHGFRPANDENETAARNSISALHTLSDDETVVRLATGIKRLTLPAGWNFLKLFEQMAAEDSGISAATRSNAWSEIAQELSDRRQYSRAVEALKKALEIQPNGDLKKSLQNQISQIVDPMGSFNPLPSQAAGSEAKLSLTFRNATKISLSARKVDVEKLLADAEAYLRSSPQNLDWGKANVGSMGHQLLEENSAKYLTGKPTAWDQDLTPRPNHWDRNIDLPTPLKEGGAWLVEGTFEGGHKTRALLWLEDIVIVQTRQAGAGHYFVADARTGAPVAGATVKFFGYKYEWTERRRQNRSVMAYTFKNFQAVTDDKGQVKASGNDVNEFQWLIQAKSPDGKQAHFGFQHLYYGEGRDRFNEETRLYTITDRPVYRPGQEVKWKAWARQVGYDPKVNTNRYAKAQIEVIIHDPRGGEISKKTYKADDSGAVDGVLELGDDATLGQYSFEMTWKRALLSDEHLGGHQFRVEEYKKPEFEVQVKAPDAPVSLGDSFEIKVKADYYFGGPVKLGKVKYKVQRSVHNDRWFPFGPWDWLFGPGYGWRASYYAWYPGADRWCFCIPRYPWIRPHSDPPELVAEGEAPLNADGTFTVKIDTALAKELHGDQDHKYEVEAEVTDQSRRTIFGKGSVLAARRPYEVYVSADRGYYQAGESGQITVHARTLDGKEVKAEGTLNLYRITYDGQGKPAEESVATAAVKLDENNGHRAAERLTFARSGQYRISVKLKDAAGHEVEGISFLTVRGEGFDDGKGFRFDDLELITQKEEYAPGEEVELTLNTNLSGSTVALFLRTQNSIYPDPVWLKLDGKSTTYKFKLSEADQPNIFVEAYTVSQARVHQITRQIIVPPKKRIATVELTPDSKTYLPGQGSKVKVQVKDQDGKPFTGKVVLTAYDKSLEYISGGSNQEDIRPFFWGWKRSHYPQVQDTLRELETGLIKAGEDYMQPLGIFGHSVADEGNVDAFSVNGGMRTRHSNYAAPGGLAGRSMAMMDMSATGGAPPPPPAPMAAPAAVAAVPMEMAKSKGEALGVAPSEPDQEEGPQPMIRSNLADSAVWIADFTTDAQGQGEFSFNLPDNLTTWKLRSWVMGPNTQVGEAGVEVITRKNLMVRLQAPRFFVEKDEVVISANVHNEMDVEQNVRPLLELEGGVLEFLNEGGGSLPAHTIAAHGEHRFDWRVKATGEGQAKIRVKALAQKDSDAMEMTFPVYIHGVLKTDSWSLALRANEASGKITLKVPAERKPEQSRLEVRYSPTLAMALVDALPYLVDYPYGCTEQTLNRFVPTVITLGILKDLGVDLKQVKDKTVNLNAQEIGKPEDRAQRWKRGGEKGGRHHNPVFDEDEVKKMVKTGLARLEAMRNGDGGWGWFPGGQRSSPHITAVVLHGLKAAEHAGQDVNDGLIRNGVTWLTECEKAELRRLNLPKEHKNHKPAPDNLDALIHSVLVEYKAGDKAMRNQLYEKRNSLSRYNLALLGLACDAVEENERRDMCLRNLKQFLKEDEENQTAWLDLPQGGWWWYWYEDQIETQAAFLRLLTKADPKGTTASRIAKYILNNRRNGTYWNSTKDTAAVIEALAVYAKASGESKPKQTVEVLVDGKSVKKVEITPETLFTFDGTLELEGDELTTGEHTVELRKLGESPLYANAYLTVFSKEDMIPAAGLEVKARRKFYKLIEEKNGQQVAGSRGQVVTQQGLKYRREEIASDTPVKSGDLIEVELSVDSKNDYEYVLIEDLKPAGFEPVEVRSGWSYDGLAAYQEFRDEKVAFFAESLPKGTHNLRYRVKAEIPGRFSALPTKVEGMYAPELKGNSDEWKARIEE
ncbi:MAG TPA: MG2 domain-containing protein [Prosthecobacter sp.]